MTGAVAQVGAWAWFCSNSLFAKGRGILGADTAVTYLKACGFRQ